MKWGGFIFNNFWAKVIALILAMATWFYVFDLINRDPYPQKETLGDIISKYNFVIKEIPVKPVFAGKSPEGYNVIYNDLRVQPPVVAVMGPEEILNTIQELHTERINLSEYTRSTELRLSVSSDNELIKVKDKMVTVFMPVEQTS